MIYVKTRMWAVDNCGAKVVECIKVLKKKYQQGEMGDEIVIAVKSARPRKKVKKHDVHRALIVRTKKRIYRKGYRLWFNKNGVVIIDKKGNPFANRMKGSICQEIRSKRYMKLVSLASSIL
jgi:large subunit ribosomal protein L14